MGKVVGLGGVFVEFKGDKEALHHWYEKVLKCDMSEYGTGFVDGQQLMLVSFKRSVDQSILNFRVQGLKDLLEDVVNNQGKVLAQEATPYGDFATIEDPFGNKVELWQAETEAYKAMVKEEIKNYKNRS